MANQRITRYTLPQTRSHTCRVYIYRLDDYSVELWDLEGLGCSNLSAHKDAILGVQNLNPVVPLNETSNQFTLYQQ